MATFQFLILKFELTMYLATLNMLHKYLIETELEFFFEKTVNKVGIIWIKYRQIREVQFIKIPKRVYKVSILLQENNKTLHDLKIQLGGLKEIKFFYNEWTGKPAADIFLSEVILAPTTQDKNIIC